MKLAIVMPPYHPMPPSTGGGVERLCDILIRSNEISNNPLDIIVFSRYDENAAEAAKEFLHTQFVYLDTTKSEPSLNRFERGLRKKLGYHTPVRYDYLRALKKALSDMEFDEILLENCFEFARPIYKLTSIKPIFHAHNCFFGEEYTDAPKSYSAIKKFIFVSEYLKNAAIKSGVPSDKCSVLYDCVDTGMFDALRYAEIREEKRAKYGLTNDDILAVFVGRLTPEKGVVELVKAIDQSNYSESKLMLLIVGSAHYGEDIRDEYREILERAAPEGKVIFIGSVKPTSTARFLARADFAVVPSIWEEPAGLQVLEAMSIGLPLIVSDSGGIGEYAGEYIKAGGCEVVKRGLGYVNSLACAIDKIAMRLHSDPEWRLNNAEAARKCALEFDSCRYYEKFIELIER
jgi:spore coat protein SA